jgi:hypothetical protein
VRFQAAGGNETAPVFGVRIIRLGGWIGSLRLVMYFYKTMARDDGDAATGRRPATSSRTSVRMTTNGVRHMWFSGYCFTWVSGVPGSTGADVTAVSFPKSALMDSVPWANAPDV